MLSNAYFLAKIRFDTAENEPAKNLQKISKKILTIANFANFAFCLGDLAGVLGRHDHAVEVREDPLRPVPRLADGPDRVVHFAKFRQNVARFRLYRHRFLQENTRFAAFFKIYQII